VVARLRSRLPPIFWGLWVSLQNVILKESACKINSYRVLRKYPNQNPVISELFDTEKLMDLYKKQ